MRSSFFGLNLAVNGLYTAQRGLDTVNHNINNVTTPGYTRQTNEQHAAQAMPVYDGTGMVGMGSEVTAVNRVRDEYLDFKYWSENVSYGEWQVKSDQLANIEASFNEPSDSGFNTVLNNYFNSIQDLSKDPSSLPARKAVIGDGVSLSVYFNNLASRFQKMQSELNNSVKMKVDQVNSLGTQIQQLNKQIYALESDGNTANDLRDQRGVLVDQLSKIVNVQANEVVVGKLPDGRDNKHFVISISGKDFIDHFNLSKLQVVQRSDKMNTNEDVPNLYDVAWADGNSLDIRGGELKGYLDVRDGNEGLKEGNTQSPDYQGIPYYLRKLNDFVRKFALQMNEGITESQDASGNTVYTKTSMGHADGFGLAQPGDNQSPTGIRFFTVNGLSASANGISELNSNEFIDSTITTDASGNPLTGQALTDAIAARYNSMTAENFRVSGDLLHQKNPENNVAASSIAGQTEDKGTLQTLIDMRDNTHLFAEGTPEDYMQSLVASLGVDSQQAQKIQGNQDNIIKQIDNGRQSTSGVSLDEEMSNMVKYQHAYSAAAKMVSTMAGIYDTLINKVGISGR